jgi:hypothetical protein
MFFVCTEFLSNPAQVYFDLSQPEIAQHIRGCICYSACTIISPKITFLVLNFRGRRVSVENAVWWKKEYYLGE